MKLSTKMLLLVAVSVVGLAISVTSSFFILQKLKVNGPIYKEIVQGKDLAADILPPPEYIIESYLVLQRLNDETDAGKKQAFVKEFEKLKKDFEERHEFWKKELPEGEIKKILLQDSYTPAEAFYKSAKETYIPALLRGDATTASEAMKSELEPNYISHRTQIDKLVDLVNKHCTAIEDSATVSLKGYLTTIVIINLLILCGIIAFGLFILRSITKPVAELVAMNERLADGDLTIAISVSGSDEIGQLADSTRRVVNNMREMLAKVTNTSSQVASAAVQLSSTSKEIATGTEEVVAQANTIATADEEMSATSSDIAKNCQFAAEGAQHASKSAQAGVEVVGKTISVMSQIADKVQESARTVESLGGRSDQIGAIIGTIEDIADQTNLLALNAAIEAARAGEQGRGFAVVADEVRALAERTTKATKEIGEMIKAIQHETKNAVVAMEQGVQQVETGSAEAARSGEALNDILEQVNAVAMQVNQIATAAEEQTATTSEISNNMLQITRVVEQAAQGAHESSKSAESLSANAEELQRLVRQFKL